LQVEEIVEPTLSLRQEFSELVGDHEDPQFCITDEEAAYFLKLGDFRICSHAFRNCANWLFREGKKGHRFQQDELLNFIENEIPKILVKKVPVIVPESVEHIKQSRQRFGSKSNFAQQLAEEAPLKLAGREISVEEAQHILEVSQGKVGIAMQSLRVVGTFIGTRLHSNVSHEEMLRRIEVQIEKELSRLAAKISSLDTRG
jgi:hypothetical protein